MTETVWLKQHTLIFGATPAAYGSILCAYFLGIAAGAALFRKLPRFEHRYLFAALFAGALALSFAWPPLFFWAARWLLGPVLESPAYQVVRWFVATVGVLPVCVAWGAFLPLGARSVSRRRFLVFYGVNTLGAALGVCAGSFLLPYAIGSFATSAVAIAVNLGSLLALYRLVPLVASRRFETQTHGLATRDALLALGGGALSMTLQVLFIRFIAIGTDNTIYSFGAASLLVVLALTFSSLLTPRLPARWFKNKGGLHSLLLLSPLGILLAIAWFMAATNGLRVAGVARPAGFGAALEFGAGVVGLGYLFPSFIFPFLLRSLKPSTRSEPAAADIGLLIAFNSLGCAAGALVAASLGVPLLGMWGVAAITLIGYVLLSFLIERTFVKNLLSGLALLVIALENPLDHPLSTPEGAQARLVEASEGAYGIVSVVDQADRRGLWLN
ncbi:MAG TPA: hypothetical protein VGP93_08790, partial [Polyangiaceae bacterium]|nr:hypothetical protein [Polyangiaceae bacterium]